MPYATLTRKIIRPDHGFDDTVTWKLEVPVGHPVVPTSGLENIRLFEVLSMLEANLGYRLVGQDGPNQFILHKNPESRGARLRNC